MVVSNSSHKLTIIAGTPFTLYLDVENDPNPARIHFEKTNITFLHDGKKGLQFIFSLQYPFVPSSLVAQYVVQWALMCMVAGLCPALVIVGDRHIYLVLQSSAAAQEP